MDELIRELEKQLRLVGAQWAAAKTPRSRTYLEGQRFTAQRSLEFAREAKRRMADREPAWILEP